MLGRPLTLLFIQADFLGSTFYELFKTKLLILL